MEVSIAPADFLRNFALLSSRAFGLVLLLPLGAYSILPIRQTILAFALAALFFSPNHPAIETHMHSLVGEFAVGFLIGLPFRLAVAGIGMFIELLEVGRGQQNASMSSVTNDGEGGTLAVLAEGWIVSALFYTGLIEVLLSGFAVSLRCVPLGAAGVLPVGILASNITGACSQAVSLALLYALPILICFASLDLCLGLLCKVAPGIVSFSGAFLLKFALLLVVLLSAERQALVVGLISLIHDAIGTFVL